MNIQYYFEDGDKEYSLDCEIDYTPASSGWFEPGGLQIEPDQPEDAELYSAKLSGIDIVLLLSDDVMNDIVQKAMDKIHEDQREYSE